MRQAGAILQSPVSSPPRSPDAKVGRTAVICECEEFGNVIGLITIRRSEQEQAHADLQQLGKRSWRLVPG